MNGISQRQNILIQYLNWYFFDVPQNILKAWENFLRFNLNYFSIPLLLKTFFSAWRRYQYSYGKGFNLGRYFEVFTFNLMSRTIGAILRSFLIIIGILVEIFIFFAGAILFLGWFFLPAFLFIGLIFGFKIIF